MNAAQPAADREGKLAGSALRLTELHRYKAAALLVIISVPVLINFVAPIFIDVVSRPASRGGMGLSATFAGGIVTAELLAIAITSLILGSVRVAPRPMAIAGAVIAIIANLLCLLVDGQISLIMLRVLAGIGFGAAGASGMLLLSGLADPDRAAAYAVSLWTAMGAILLFVLPWLVGDGGSDGIYLTLAAFAGAAIVAATVLPAIAPRDATVDEGEGRSDAGTWHSRPNAISLMAACGILLLFLGDVLIYSFALHYGARAHIDGADVSRLLAAYTVVGIFIAAMAGPVADRFGRVRPIILLCVVKVAGSLLLIYASPWSFVAAQGLLTAGFYALQPWMLGTVAVADRSGRSNAIALGCMGVGGSIAPFLGGFLIDNFPYWAAPAASAGVTALALVFGALSAAHVQRHALG